MLSAKNGERKALNASLARNLAYISLFVVIFSGKFSIERFVDVGSIPYLLEIRIYAIAAAVAAYYLGLRRGYFAKPSVTREKLVFLGLLVIFYSYAVCNIAGWGNPNMATGLLIDAVVTGVTLLLVALIISTREDVAGFLRTAEIIGVAFIVMVLFGVGKSDSYGPGWALFDGKITFYRIEFFSFCAAMYLASISEITLTKILHYLLACLCLYATIATLSKASLIGVLSAFLIMWFYWLVFSRYKPVIVLILISLVTGIVYYYENGDKMYLRLAKGFSVERSHSVNNYSKVEKNINISNISKLNSASLNSEMGVNSDQITLLTESIITKVSDNTKYSDYSSEERAKLEALWVIFDESGAPDYKDDFSDFILWISSLAIVVDGSSRLRMAQAALTDFKNNIWFGSGMYNYTYWSLNSSASGSEVYKYPHNIILEVAASMGLLGLVLFGGAITAGLVFVTKQLIDYPNAVYLIAYLIFFVVTSLFSGDLYDFRIFWIGICLILSMKIRTEGTIIKVNSTKSL